MSTLDEKKSELQSLQARQAELEAELQAMEPVHHFQPQGFYTAYYAMSGFMLGIVGAMASLIFNVVGSAATGKHPLEIIRVYLTFPMGDKALSEDMNTGLALAIGCCLYLATGMLLGIPVYLAMAKWSPEGPLSKRLIVATIVSLAIWVVNYYVVLSWLQPALIEMTPDNLIARQVPWWVGCATHLVFGWTLAVVYPYGQFDPYRRPTEQA
ncbi:MAG: hypothetical protein KDA61_12225 [Planctomycetales bacterium]|nr:hypothetical protein [Planctomycetales bacterium]